MTDAEAVERCYREQGVKLWRAVLLFGGDPDVASDAVSEAFAQALRRGSQIRSVDAWVWRAAFKIAGAELKRRRTLAELVELPVDMSPPTVDLVRALRSLSPKQRGAVILHHYAGYSNRETAAILGSTTAAVGVHLQRARAHLRTALEVPDDA